MGVVAIDFTEIAAFQHATGLRLTAWEVGVIEELDDLYLAARHGPPPEPPLDEDDA